MNNIPTLKDGMTVYVDDYSWPKQTVYYQDGHAALFAGVVMLTADRTPRVEGPHLKSGQKVRVGRKTYTIEKPGFLGGDSCVLRGAR